MFLTPSPLQSPETAVGVGVGVGVAVGVSVGPGAQCQRRTVESHPSWPVTPEARRLAVRPLFSVDSHPFLVDNQTARVGRL